MLSQPRWGHLLGSLRLSLTAPQEFCSGGISRKCPLLLSGHSQVGQSLWDEWGLEQQSFLAVTGILHRVGAGSLGTCSGSMLSSFFKWPSHAFCPTFLCLFPSPPHNSRAFMAHHILLSSGLSLLLNSLDEDLSANCPAPSYFPVHTPGRSWLQSVWAELPGTDFSVVLIQTQSV